MTLIDEGFTSILDTVGIWGARPQAHQDHAEVIPEPEIHAPLKVNPLFLTHVQVRDDTSRAEHLKTLIPSGFYDPPPINVPALE